MSKPLEEKRTERIWIRVAPSLRKYLQRQANKQQFKSNKTKPGNISKYIVPLLEQIKANDNTDNDQETNSM